MLAGARLPRREMEKRSRRKKSPSRRSSRLRRFSWYITFKKVRKRAGGKFSLAGRKTPHPGGNIQRDKSKARNPTASGGGTGGKSPPTHPRGGVRQSNNHR